MDKTVGRVSQVSEQLMALHKKIDEQSEIIGALLDRLSPVLRPSESKDGVSEKMPNLVKLAEEILSISYSLEERNGTLRDILNRIEL